MKTSHDAIEESYALCRRLCRHAGSSFYAGFRLLPAEKRRGMEALYAFMRHTDDMADNSPDEKTSQLAALSSWREDLSKALQGDCPASSSGLRSLLTALADTVRRFQIPQKHLMAVIDGVEMDLEPRRYETFSDLERYCELVASAVGMACIHIWGFRGPEAFEPARQIGVAMQLTNILRDLKEDAQAGRVYLPQNDLRECGYSADDLSAGVVNEPFFSLMRLEIERAEHFYREGIELFDFLEPEVRRIFGLMTATYLRLLKKIEHCPADVFRCRVQINPITKFRLFLNWRYFSPSLAGELARCVNDGT